MIMDPERRRRLLALSDWHREWSARNQAAASQAFQPRAAASDYNVHHVDVDASGAAEDEFHARAMQIMAPGA